MLGEKCWSLNDNHKQTTTDMKLVTNTTLPTMVHFILTHVRTVATLAASALNDISWFGAKIFYP